MVRGEIVAQDDAWVAQAKRNLTAAYEGQPLERMPFEWMLCRIEPDWFVHPMPEAGAQQARTIGEVREEFFDAERALETQLAQIATRVREGFWDDRVLNLQPLGGPVGWLPEVFGATTRWFVNRPCYPEPVIYEAGQIDRLKPDFGGSELYNAALKRMRLFRSAVGDRIPVATPDLQSPVDVASMILDYTQLIYAMVDDPPRVHALLRMVTDATIAACRAFREEMATDWPTTHFGWWMPHGIFMSDDLLAVLSPELYREFAMPYNEALGEALGGVALHSCGRIVHNLENVAQTRGILALNTHDPGAVAAPIVKDRLVLIIGGVHEHMMSTHPESRRASITDAQTLEDFWWADAGRLAEIRHQRIYYQCHALLHKRSAEEAYQRMLALSRQMARDDGRGDCS